MEENIWNARFRRVLGGIGWVSAIVGIGLVVGWFVNANPKVSAGGGGVCDRNSEVRAVVIAATGVADCSQVTDRHLRDVTELDLSDRSITSLGSGDFNGMVRLQSLDLSGNSLTTLPQGVFDHLFLLKSLHLSNNQLTTLAVDLFDEVLLLEELDLSGNPSLSLSEGMFDDFDRFSGIGADGEPVAAGESHPVIERFLKRHSVTSPEEFIEALPDLHKERFVMVYQSEAAAKDHVSTTHPRIISFGGDGRFTFAWNTDPDAPSKFREVVEFLRQNDSDWSVGIIDFSGDSPRIVEPAICQSCHGSVNKPLWGTYTGYGATGWVGTEFAQPHGAFTQEEYEEVAAATQTALQSDDPRIEPLDFSPWHFIEGFHVLGVVDYGIRYMTAREGIQSTMAVEEAGAIWSWRHVEVLNRRLQASEEDYRSFAEGVMCASSIDAFEVGRAAVQNKFPKSVHMLDTLATPDERRIQLGEEQPEIEDDYRYHLRSGIADAVAFLVAVDLWQDEPVIRKLFRETSNLDAVPSARHRQADDLLYYDKRSATAEDELIQKLRFYFGRGTRGAIKERVWWNDRSGGANYNFGAAFSDGLLEVMAPRMCSALRGGKPGNLLASSDAGDVDLSWDAPEWATTSVTGYRILRGPDIDSLEVLVADTDTRATTWSDDDVEPGDYVYAVKAVYDDYYPGPQSDPASQTITLVEPAAPGGLSAVSTDVSVTVSWSVPAQPAGVWQDEMFLERLGDDDSVVRSMSVADEWNVGQESSWSHTEWHLSAGTVYRYRVRLATADKGDVYSEVLSVSTQSDSPVAPRDLSATVDADGQVSLEWTIPVQPLWLNGVEFLLVERSDTGIFIRLDAVEWQAGTTSYSFVDTTARRGLPYEYRVKIGAAGLAFLSDTVSVTVPPRQESGTGPLAGFSLFDAADQSLLAELVDGATVTLSGADSGNFAIRADLAEGQSAGSVYLELSGLVSAKRTENWSPYSLYGDRGHSNLRGGGPLPTGDYTLTATAYSMRYRRGDVLGTLEIAFTIAAGNNRASEVSSTGPVAGFSLFDAADQTRLAPLTDGAEIALADPDGGSFAIVADIAGGRSVGSLYIELSGAGTATRAENYAPYSLYGDDTSSEGVKRLHGQALPAGSYTLRATAYSERRRGGEVLGTLQVEFQITQDTG